MRAPASFIDQAGRLNGVLYMENKDDTNPAAGLTRRATLPTGSVTRASRVLPVRVPDAKVLREATGMIEGQPAWIAVAQCQMRHL